MAGARGKCVGESSRTGGSPRGSPQRHRGHKGRREAGVVIRDGKVTLKLSSNSCSGAAFYPSAGSITAIAGYDLSTALHLAKLCAASVVKPFPFVHVRRAARNNPGPATSGCSCRLADSQLVFPLRPRCLCGESPVPPPSTFVQFRQKPEILATLIPELIQSLPHKSPMPVANRLPGHIHARFAP